MPKRRAMPGARSSVTRRLPPLSLACPSYNDRPRLERLLDCIPRVEAIDEVFIVDHRSDDDTLALLEHRAPELERCGIRLRWTLEPRDFGPEFTMADLRNRTIDGCENDIVYVADADHVLGPAFDGLAQTAIELLEAGDDYAVGHELVSIIGEVVYDAEGRIVAHGECYRHVEIPRFVLKGHAICRQDGESGRYYGCHPAGDERRHWKTIPCPHEAIIAIDDRPAARHLLRRTMNNYFQRSVGGELEGTWHEEYRRGVLVDDINAMDFFHASNRIDVSLVGQRYFGTGRPVD